MKARSTAIYGLGVFLVIFCALVAPDRARAGDFGTASNVVVLGGLGAGVGVGMNTAQTAASLSSILTEWEAEDWKTQETGTTSDLDAACGVNLESRLISTWRENAFFVGIQNQGSTALIIKPLEIRFVFSNGKERTASFPDEVGNLELKPGWKLMAFIPAPDKQDFKDQDSVRVEVPLWTTQGGVQPVCVPGVQLRRNLAVSQRAETYTSFTILDWDLLLGSSLSRAGAFGGLFGNGGVSGGFDMHLFWSVHHGIVLGLIVSDLGNAGSRFPFLPPDISLTGGDAWLGYAYRSYMGRRWSWGYEIGPAVHGVSWSDQYAHDSSSSLALHQSVNLDWTFAQVSSGAFSSSFAAGVSLYDVWFGPENLYGTSLQGNELGMLFRLKWGI